MEAILALSIELKFKFIEILSHFQNNELPFGRTLVLLRHSVNYLYGLREKPFARLAGSDVARDGHFCGKSGTRIGGNDHWSPVGDEKDEGVGRDRASNSRIVWRA